MGVKTYIRQVNQLIGGCQDIYSSSQSADWWVSRHIIIKSISHMHAVLRKAYGVTKDDLLTKCRFQLVGCSSHPSREEHPIGETATDGKRRKENGKRVKSSVALIYQTRGGDILSSGLPKSTNQTTCQENMQPADDWWLISEVHLIG